MNILNLETLTDDQAAALVSDVAPGLKHLVAGGLMEGDIPQRVVPPWDLNRGVTFNAAGITSFTHAISAARAAFEGRCRNPLSARGVLRLMACKVRENQEELALLIAFETGKLIPAARMESAATAASLDYWANAQIPDPEETMAKGSTTRLTRRPVGVVAAITPFNMPVLMMANKIGAALITGNTIVCKPSPIAPLSPLYFAGLIAESVPEGWVNILAGEDTAGILLSTSPDVALVSFTGSIDVGKAIMRSAAGTLKRLHLELGGNDAAIVGPDADLDTAIPQIFRGAFGSSGQACVAVKRVYAHSSQADEVTQRLSQLARQVRVGSPFDTESTAPVLATAAQYERVEELLEDARSQGAHIAFEGERTKASGYFMNPSIVSQISNGTRLVDHEQFGPILPVVAYENTDQLIRLANDGPYGLGATVWSDEEEFLETMTHQLNTGMLWLNGLGRPDPSIPFGGVKESGIGREGGLAGIDAFCELAAITRYPSMQVKDK